MFSHRMHPVRITTAVEERLVLAREDRETASWHLQWYCFISYETPLTNKDSCMCGSVYTNLLPSLDSVTGLVPGQRRLCVAWERDRLLTKG